MKRKMIKKYTLTSGIDLTKSVILDENTEIEILEFAKTFRKFSSEDEAISEPKIKFIRPDADCVGVTETKWSISRHIFPVEEIKKIADILEIFSPIKASIMEKLLSMEMNEIREQLQTKVISKKFGL
jgi:hypothetical protein